MITTCAHCWGYDDDHPCICHLRPPVDEYENDRVDQAVANVMVPRFPLNSLRRLVLGVG